MRKGSGRPGTAFQYIKGPERELERDFIKRHEVMGQLYLKRVGFRFNIRKKIISVRVMRHWYRLPRVAPSLEVLNGDLSNLF